MDECLTFIGNLEASKSLLSLEWTWFNSHSKQRQTPVFYYQFLNHFWANFESNVTPQRGESMYFTMHAFLISSFFSLISWLWTLLEMILTWGGTISNERLQLEILLLLVCTINMRSWINFNCHSTWEKNLVTASWHSFRYTERIHASIECLVKWGAGYISSYNTGNITYMHQHISFM